MMLLFTVLSSNRIIPFVCIEILTNPTLSLSGSFLIVCVVLFFNMLESSKAARILHILEI